MENLGKTLLKRLKILLHATLFMSVCLNGNKQERRTETTQYK